MSAVRTACLKSTLKMELMSLLMLLLLLMLMMMMVMVVVVVVARLWPVGIIAPRFKRVLVVRRASLSQSYTRQPARWYADPLASIGPLPRPLHRVQNLPHSSTLTCYNHES